MKNTQRGFVMPLLLAIIAILLVGGGVYVYTQNKQTSQPVVVSQTSDTTSTVQTANLKTYTNTAFGFSITLPSNTNVYTCEDTSSRPTVANEKSYRVFILENPSDIDLMKSCDYSERAKYNNLYISASRSTPGAYSDLVANWKKGYGDGKYVTLEQTTFAGHEALIKTKVEGPNNDNLYKEVVVNGGTYSYDLSFAKKSDSLEKILATFKVLPAKDNLSDWQTLKSNDLGIEIKFPNDYRSNTVNSQLVAASDLTIYPVPQPIEFGPRLVVSRNSDHITVNTNADTYVDGIFVNDKSKSVKERGYTTINSTKWVKVRYLDVSGAGPEMTYVNYFAIKNGYMYTVGYNETSQVNTGNFEKIVGTITFFQSAPSSANQNGTTPVTVSGMSKYTDSNFGFSFWYPNTWTVQNATIKDNYTGGTIQKTLTIASNGTSGEAITIDEFSSPTREITIASDLCSPMSGSSVPAHRYYFDVNAHTWMEEIPAYTGYSGKDGSPYSVPASIKAADVSSNTMGGLHMLGAGCSGSVIPLSAKNFVVFLFNSRDVGPYYINIAKTITATDPSVATPVSSAEQIQTITNAGVMLGAIGTKVGEWHVTSDYVYNGRGDIVVGANPSTFRLISTYSDGTTGTSYATDGVHIYSAWSYEAPVLSGADPATFVAIRQQYQIPYAQSSGLYGQSFTAYDTQFAKDKSHVWYQSRLIPGADPNTFVVTGNTHVQNSAGGYTLAHDASHLYGVDAKDKLTVDGVTIQ